MDIEPKGLLRTVRARPFGCGFTWQVHAAQALYGAQLRVAVSDADVAEILDQTLSFYPKRDVPYIRDRVVYCIKTQRAKMKQADSIKKTKEG